MKHPSECASYRGFLSANVAIVREICYIRQRLMTNAMKYRFILLTLAVAVLSSMSLFAQGQRNQLPNGAIYEGDWPKGEGVLYSREDGLILGTFDKGVPHGKCVCYRPNGDVYWGDFKKGKATGHAYVFRDQGSVITGMYKNGRFHGRDTIYRKDGAVFIGKFKNGKLKERLYVNKIVPEEIMEKKPSYPRIDFRRRQEQFMNEMEETWQDYYIGIKHTSGFIHPKFQGGDVNDFSLWVNSNVAYPSGVDLSKGARTVLVEFTVMDDGTVADVHTVFGTNSLLNEAAENAVRKSPKWTPGELNGEKKGARMTIPVVFDLE